MWLIWGRQYALEPKVSSYRQRQIQDWKETNICGQIRISAVSIEPAQPQYVLPRSRDELRITRISSGHLAGKKCAQDLASSYTVNQHQC